MKMSTKYYKETKIDIEIRPVKSVKIFLKKKKKASILS